MIITWICCFDQPSSFAIISIIFGRACSAAVTLRNANLVLLARISRALLAYSTLTAHITWQNTTRHQLENPTTSSQQLTVRICLPSCCQSYQSRNFPIGPANTGKPRLLKPRRFHMAARMVAGFVMEIKSSRHKKRREIPRIAEGPLRINSSHNSKLYHSNKFEA